MFKRLFERYRSYSKNKPLQCAFITCLVKGSASDLIAQKVVERRKEINFKRNLVFATYSGTMCFMFLKTHPLNGGNKKRHVFFFSTFFSFK